MDDGTLPEDLEQLLAIPPLTLSFASPLSSVSSQNTPEQPRPNNPTPIPRNTSISIPTPPVEPPSTLASTPSTIEEDEHEYEYASEIPMQEKMSKWMQNLREYGQQTGKGNEGQRNKKDWRVFAKRLYERQIGRSRDFVCWEAQDVKMYHQGLRQPLLPPVPERPFHGIRESDRNGKENRNANIPKDELKPLDNKESISASVESVIRGSCKLTASTQTTPAERVEDKDSGVKYNSAVVSRLDKDKLALCDVGRKPRLVTLRAVRDELRRFEDAALAEVEELIVELRKQQRAYDEQVLARASSSGKRVDMTSQKKLKFQGKGRAKAKPKVFFAGGNSNSSNVYVKASLKRKKEEPQVTVGHDAVGLSKWKGSGFLIDLLEQLIARLRVKVGFAMLKLTYRTALKRFQLVADRGLDIVTSVAANCFVQLKTHYEARAWLRERYRTKRIHREQGLGGRYFKLWSRNAEEQILSRGKALNACLFRDQVMRWRYFSCWRASVYLSLYNTYCSTSVLLWRRLSVQGLAFHGWRSIIDRDVRKRQRLCAALEGTDMPTTKERLGVHVMMRTTRRAKMEKFVAFREQLEVSGRQTLQTLRFELGLREPSVTALYGIESTSQLAQHHKESISSWRTLARARSAKELQRLYHPFSEKLATHLKFKAVMSFPANIDISLPMMVKTIRSFLARQVGYQAHHACAKTTTQDLAVLLHNKKILATTLESWKAAARYHRARRHYERTRAVKAISALVLHARNSVCREEAIVSVCNQVVYSHVLDVWQSCVERWRNHYLSGMFSPWNRWKRYTQLQRRLRAMGTRCLARRYFAKLHSKTQQKALLRKVFSFYEDRANARETFLQDRYAAEFNTLLRLFRAWKEETDCLIAGKNARARDIAARTFYEQGLLRKAFSELVEGCGKAYFGPSSWR